MQDILFVEKSKTKDFVENHDFDAGGGEHDTIVCFVAILDHFGNINFDAVVGESPGTTAKDPAGRSHGEGRERHKSFSLIFYFILFGFVDWRYSTRPEAQGLGG